MRWRVGTATRDVELEAVIIAGYTGRDRAAVQHHIDELAAIGVPPPPSFPAYWLQPPWLAMSSDEIVVVGERTSGEAELALVGDGDDLFVTLASDHTDRAAEAIDVELSKAICPVPVAAEAWPLARRRRSLGRAGAAQLDRRGRSRRRDGGAVPGRCLRLAGAAARAARRLPPTTAAAVRDAHRHGAGRRGDPSEPALPRRAARPGGATARSTSTTDHLARHACCADLRRNGT